MWIRHLFLGFIGLAAGGAVAAGTFAFIIVIGVVPRMIAKCNLAKYTVLLENMIVLGGIVGNLISVFTGLPLPLGRGLLILFGLSAGIFVGCIAVAILFAVRRFLFVPILDNPDEAERKLEKDQYIKERIAEAISAYKKENASVSLRERAEASVNSASADPLSDKSGNE